ncbi:hypothetical protein DEU56DRAFT_779121 [Suillus clintonianus]|uniref:uncharacterized protein n=1 Tax=Suillus clintonianus TaxID=1904413 RepID=UPI001B8769EC|nr:uncharacterized protein DEU56DRAFT_779121 [Suillus clintonianus]KAG2150920.1 hypothetical protein DEU56DRAFT_779121 [Suillus clintonianus]
MPTTLCSAKASYKKQAGTLELTDSLLTWTQEGKKAPAVRVLHPEATSLFCSKEGAAQVRLKLGLVNDEAGHNFTFTSPSAVAYVEREAFKQELTNIISRNRSAAPTPAQKPTPLTASSTPAKTPAPIPSTSRATSVSSDSRTPILSGIDAATDFRLRKKVLLSNPELLALHKELVMSGHITESEFWDGREHLLLAEAAAEGQKRGRPGQLVDPRPQTVEGGEVKIVITPQLVHDIFDEFPVVAKAYNDNVPNKLSEAEFWKRYFQSKLFNAHRASIRSSATQHVVKEDPIFDKYLEKDDDELEPRRARNEVSDLFINIGATLEDHIETGNEKDVTMQAGRQRGALPLIRKFNEHSERLLNSALGEVPPAKRRRIDSSNDDDDAYAQITLDDLRDPEATSGIALQMQDRERYFEGQLARTASEQADREVIDVRAAFAELKHGFGGWETRFSQFRIDKRAGDAALASMTQNVSARLDIRTRKVDFPPTLFRQLTTCQTAANEFLRQFWTSLYPPPTTTSSTATPSQNAAKASKMAAYLSKTHEKVEALVRAGQLEGVEPERVQVAMKPLLDAVEHALAFYRARSGKPSTLKIA